MTGDTEDYDNVIEAFKIFKKYAHNSWVGSFHDELHAGPSPEVVTSEDKDTLAGLGWNDYGDGSFTYFT